ncbi:hypothetical protein CQA15_29555, partial [Klebsiella pneumoniae]
DNFASNEIIVTGLSAKEIWAQLNDTTLWPNYYKQSAIIWPNDYLPGTTDNFASNEIIVTGLSAKEIWAQLNDTTLWPNYY